MDSVQIFVKPIEQECQELLRVLLLEAIEPWGVLSDGPLKKKRR